MMKTRLIAWAAAALFLVSVTASTAGLAIASTGLWAGVDLQVMDLNTPTGLLSFTLRWGD